MTQRLLGEPGSPKRRRFLFLPILLVALSAMFWIAGAQAVHDVGVFELDDNAVTNNSGSGLPDDWDRICKTATNGAQCSSAGSDNALFRSFDIDVTGAGDDIFTGAQPGGSSKDPDVISGWRWKQSASSSAPDKDDLEQAYTGQYIKSISGVDTVFLYFGADRFAVSGDSQLGFWFFRSKITKVAPTSGDVGTFGGGHTQRVLNPDGTIKSRGDILVLSDFLQGGASPTVRVFEWVGSGGSDGSLDLIAGTTAEPADCNGGPGKKPSDPPVPPVGNGDNFCATVNTSEQNSPWSYTPKSGTANKFPAGAFYEGGINMTALGLGNECFSTFLAETRSSQSPTAILKDFVLGGFGSCGAALTTLSSNTTSYEIGGTAPTDTATINVSGAGGNPPAPTGTVSFYLCGPSATQITSCDPTGKTAFDTKNLSGASKNGNEYSVTSIAPTITSAGYYCFAARWPGDTNYTGGPYGDNGTNECFRVTPKTPTISTQVSNAGPVVPGTAVSDSATLGNTATPSNGTNGTITFTAYGPDDATCATAVYTSEINVTGNGTYSSFTSHNAFAPTSPGTYRWIASYAPATGDVNNVAVSTTCGDANESFVVQQFQPALTTAQTWTVKDSATITVGGGGNLSGEAHFQLFRNSTCDSPATPLVNATVAVSGASPQTVETSPYTITATESTLYWKVFYHSANPAQKDIAATCTENSSVTINN